jgi:hypothetical protein
MFRGASLLGKLKSWVVASSWEFYKKNIDNNTASVHTRTLKTLNY